MPPMTQSVQASLVYYAISRPGQKLWRRCAC